MVIFNLTTLINTEGTSHNCDIKYAYFKKLDEVYKETGGFVPAKVMGPANTAVAPARQERW